MLDPAGRGVRRTTLLGLLSLLVSSVPAAAVQAPPPSLAKPTPALVDMLDARVNARGAFERASEARAGRAGAGRAEADAQSVAVEQAIADLRANLPGLDIARSQLTGGPTSVRNRRGALTAAAPGASSEEVVRGFLLDHGGVYGLSPADLDDLVALGDSPGGRSGLRMLRMEQVIDGRPIFQSETRFLLDRDGRLVKSLGQLVPGARDLAPTVDRAALLSPGEAIVRLLGSIGRSAQASAFTPRAVEHGWLRVAETDAGVHGEVAAKEVLFPLAPGLLVPGWALVVFSDAADWYAVVDAETGDVLWRKNIRNYVTTHEARFRVYVQADGRTPTDSPAPGSPNVLVPPTTTQFAEVLPTIVNMLTVQDALVSPNGWIDDCPGGICTTVDTNTSQEQTVGNNVRACMDRAAPANTCDTDVGGILDGFGKPTGNPDVNARNRDFLGIAPRDFQTGFLPPPQGGAGGGEVGQTATGAGASGTNALDQFRRGSVTQQFYVGNWYHDELFNYGFDEPSANFQQLNLVGGGGVAGDRVLIDVQDASGTNNANFATPPDGASGRAQMFRFTGPTIDRDGGLDSEILIHEFTHGTSNRLVGNAAGLNWDPAAGMGEGWSDFYALAMLNNTPADDPNGQYAAGAYATYKLIAGFESNYVYAIRRFPYSTNNTINPMTWADVDDVTINLSGGIASSPINFNDNGGMEVHNSGELWALSLWEVRSRIIADPAGANGSVPVGNTTTLQLVTDALKATPNDPSFTQGRDALFDADCATNACANEESIWGGFADRGLGYGAETPFNVMFGFTAAHLGVRESFSLPFLDVVDPGADVAIDDTAANNNGAMDPGEPILLTVTLTNPWRAASKAVTSATATLSTTTPGVTIIDNTAAYGAIAPQGTAAGDTFLITLDTTVVCGSAIDFTLSVSSNLGVTADAFELRVGDAVGTDPVVTYTHDVTPDLAIPDPRPRAVFTTFAVTDDFVISDLDFRADSVSHTFTGDLTLMLRHPDGIGVDSISLIGGLTDGGPGDNLLNMLIDDDIAVVAANDMVQVTAASAPFTGDWLPVFNAPWPPLAGFPPQDPIGNLSRFDGRSTQGTWAVAVSDQFAIDAGTLNAWSMLVTPVHFDCTAFAPAANVTATKTVTGPFNVGDTVTYTVTLTNNGTDLQLDNAGDEFTDTLPAQLTLVSAVATSGTATANIGPDIVTWNGSLAPLGGTVTITITATIDAGTEGQTVSNQGNTSYDANNDNLNEATNPTDDPGVGGAADPTEFVVGGGSVAVSGTKTAAGTFVPGGSVTYTVVLTNTGTLPQSDNPGDEFTDVLPASLTLVSAVATSGTAVANIGLNTVTWNGSLAAGGGTVTITITATIGLAATGNIDNQGTINFDADGNGTNESVTTTDDPAVGGANDPTTITVVGGGPSIVEIPTLSQIALALLALALLGFGWLHIRRS